MLGVGRGSLLDSPYQPRGTSLKTHFHHPSPVPAGSRNRRRRRLLVIALEPKSDVPGNAS